LQRITPKLEEKARLYDLSIHRCPSDQVLARDDIYDGLDMERNSSIIIMFRIFLVHPKGLLVHLAAGKNWSAQTKLGAPKGLLAIHLSDSLSNPSD
jgi:hypothetical protein